MTDARALLKAKRQEIRIAHPYATYTSSEQLKCSVCGSIVKYASAWEGHLGSKVHRMNIAKLRQEEESGHSLSQEQGPLQERPSKRKADNHNQNGTSDLKKRKVENMATPISAEFPADFFTDPFRRPATREVSYEEERPDDNMPAAPSALQPQTNFSKLDKEYERFQRELLQQATTSTTTYEHATIVAEEELFAGDATFNSEPQAFVDIHSSHFAVMQRRTTEQDEKELIMDRLLEEERAQEEADTKVSMMKARLEAVKKRREAKKAAKMQNIP